MEIEETEEEKNVLRRKLDDASRELTSASASKKAQYKTKIEEIQSEILTYKAALNSLKSDFEAKKGEMKSLMEENEVMRYKAPRLKEKLRVKSRLLEDMQVQMKLLADKVSVA